LHLDHGYYLTNENKIATNFCAKSGDYGDMAIIDYGSGNKVQVFISYKSGFGFIGPLFVPILPIFWNWGQSTYIKVNGHRNSDRIITNIPQWEVKVDDDQNWIPSRTIDQKWLKTCMYKKKKKKLSKDINNWIPCPPLFYEHTIFEFRKSRLPEKISILLKGVVIDGALQEAKEIIFQRDYHWHYMPVATTAVEWHDSSSLPCKQ